MKETQEIRDARAAYRKQVEEIAESGEYMNVTKASGYVNRYIADGWRDSLGIEREGAPPIEKTLGMSPTMLLILRLFCHAGHRIGSNGRGHVIRVWPPLYDRGAGQWRNPPPRAIAKRDIARMIGKGMTAVEKAIATFRGKRSGMDVFYEKRLAFPAFVDTGIMLDVVRAPQDSFESYLIRTGNHAASRAFARDDYEYMKRHADDARLGDADTVRKQKDWATEAVLDLVSSAPSSESIAVNDAGKRSA